MIEKSELSKKTMEKYSEEFKWIESNQNLVQMICNKLVIWNNMYGTELYLIQFN